MMTGPQHYAEAEACLDSARDVPAGTPEVAAELVAQAQVHATLALAAATALHGAHGNMPGDDRAAWVRLASEQPRANARRRQGELDEQADG